ncbi:MAG: exosortase/archaeosortase family protein [Bacteroidales bacterium]|nr:exosortase/archaeosortase family protein [Bacteroidales bacterium]
MSIERIKTYCNNPRNRSTVNVGLFILLIISFHYLYLGWQALDYWPVKGAIDGLMVWSVDLLFSQCCQVLDRFLHIDITTVSAHRILAAVNRDGGWARVVVAPECASLKQWLHWIFLMVLFPGPWRHKLWFIPAGLVIIEWTNVVRICGILMMQVWWPNIHIRFGETDINTFHLAHDYIFKVFFYFIIFLMWVFWVEKIKDRPTKNKTK